MRRYLKKLRRHDPRASLESRTSNVVTVAAVFVLIVVFCPALGVDDPSSLKEWALYTLAAAGYGLGLLLVLRFIEALIAIKRPTPRDRHL